MYSVGYSNNYTYLCYGEILEAIILIPIIWVVMIILYLFLTKNISGTKGIRSLLDTVCEQRQATPYLYETDCKTWLANGSLGHEVFGPLGLIVKVSDFVQMIEVAKRLDGQLTCTLHASDADIDFGRSLMPILTRKAGRVLANAYPTGVEVCDAMVHGGPYPASTNFGATSVGSMAIRRFLRPVCFQDIPEALLPEDLR